MRKRTKCKDCYKKLEDTSVYTGFCIDCAEKKLESISKTLIVCAIIGISLAAAFLAIVLSMRANSDGTYYGTYQGYRVYSYFITMDDITLLISCIVLFFLPFGIGLDVGYLPRIYSDDDSVFSENHGVLNVLKWILCTVLAPVFLVYMLLYMLRLIRQLALNHDIE